MSVKKKWRAQGVKQLNPSDSPRVKYCLASCKLQYSLSTSSFLLIIFFSFYRCPKKPKTTLTFASSSYLPVSSPKTSPTKKKLSHLSLLSPLHTSSCFFFSCQLLPTPCSYLDRHFLYLVPTIPFPTTPLLHYFNHRHCLVTSLPHIPCRLAPPENKKGSYSRV